MRYDDERLGRLLALLRPAPKEWVARAQLIPQTTADLRALDRKLDEDSLFRKSFDADPVGAAQEVGLPELATQLQRELAELLAGAEVLAHEAEPGLRNQLRMLLLRSEAVQRQIRSE